MRSNAKRIERMESLSQKMIDEIDSRLEVATIPSDALPLFSNTTRNWDSLTYVRNEDCWMVDLQEQLTGIHMYVNGGWYQAASLTAITRRHAISCGHWGPNPGAIVRYVSATGEVFQTTILAWVNDYPLGPTDISVYLMTDPFPDWVYIAPIIGITAADRLVTNYSMDPPSLAISQGNWNAGPPETDTPRNRKVYVKSLNINLPLNALRNPYYHRVDQGDSGTTEYVLLDGILYLYRVITAGGGYGPFVADCIRYVNSLIKRTDAVASISTGYQVSIARVY